jgi:hypothetical protein
MARSGDVLENPVTRERMVCREVARDTGGELLQADLSVGPGGFVAAEHIHAKQEDRFEVLAGVAQAPVRRDGENHAGWRGRGGSCWTLLCQLSYASIFQTVSQGWQKLGGTLFGP